MSVDIKTVSVKTAVFDHGSALGLAFLFPEGSAFITRIESGDSKATIAEKLIKLAQELKDAHAS